jgi:hypothetical protein
VTFGSKPISAPPFRPRPSARAENAFAVGSRVLLTIGENKSTKDLELLDEDGAPVGTRLPVDTLVVITAWKPRRSAPARYRVCSADRVEGWLDAVNLRRLPPPPPPPQPAQQVAPPKPKAPEKAPVRPTKQAQVARKATGVAARPQAPAPSKPVAAAAKPAAHGAKPAPRAGKPAPRPAKPAPSKKTKARRRAR